MHVSDLPIPAELIDLIEAGRWPRNADEARAQNLHLRVLVERIHRIAPEEHWIYFDPPPFVPGESLLAAPLDWNGVPDSHAPPGDIDLKRSVIIGDFGLGSDAPIALDYRRDIRSPSVIRYRWAKTGNRWLDVAPSFREFARILEL